MSHCTPIEDMIINRQIAPLSEKDERTLTEHLLNCESCFAFEAKISNLSTIEAAEKIKPRRAIKQKLLRRMRSRVQSQRGRIFDRVADMFTFRPAVYKAAAAALLLLLFILAAPQFKQPQHIVNLEYRATVVDSLSLNVINLHQIIQIVDSQKVGINLSEDTLLTKILYRL